jgi:hypothetical protein
VLQKIAVTLEFICGFLDPVAASITGVIAVASIILAIYNPLVGSKIMLFALSIVAILLNRMAFRDAVRREAKKLIEEMSLPE